MVALTLLVQPIQQHGNEPAEMRHDEFNVGVAIRDLLGNHVQDKGRILERRADRGTETIIVDEGRADAGSRRMDEENRAAPVHLGIDRLEFGLGDRTVEADDVHIDADAPQLIEPAFHLAECHVDMRQRQHDIGSDPLGMTVRQLGVAVVEHAHGSDALGLVRQIGGPVWRQHLLLDASDISSSRPLISSAESETG